MIGKVCRRGSDSRRLLGYLFLEGPAGQAGLESAHVDARVIAGYDPVVLRPLERRANGRTDVSRLAALLDAPVRAAGVGRDAKPVYHLALSAAPTDRLLTDAEWADIAAQFLDRIGLAKPGDPAAVRWVAVRHADNHVHVVATLVRQDGARVFPRNDFYRAREASLAVEAQYGLTATSPADRTGGRQTSRGEQRKHAHATRDRAAVGLPPPSGPDREVLRARVRAALAGSSSWEDFTDRLRSSGVLIRERYSTRNPGELTGYAVALPASGARVSAAEQTIWFGGGKLAPDLTLPQLQARWDLPAGTGSSGTPPKPAPPSSPPQAADTSRNSGRSPAPPAFSDERAAAWVAAQTAVRQADVRIRRAAGPQASAADLAAGQSTASAAGEVLSALCRLTERNRPGPVHRAADAYARAAREPHRRTTTATASSQALRHAAGGLLSSRLVRRAETRQLLELLTRLTSLCEALARLRDTQARAAQAAAARHAAEQLTAAMRRYTLPPDSTATTVRRLPPPALGPITRPSTITRGPTRTPTGR